MVTCIQIILNVLTTGLIILTIRNQIIIGRSKNRQHDTLIEAFKSRMK